MIYYFLLKPKWLEHISVVYKDLYFFNQIAAFIAFFTNHTKEICFVVNTLNILVQRKFFEIKLSLTLLKDNVFCRNNGRADMDGRVLVVGQGIAGTILSYALIKNGNNIKVIDNPKPLTSSKIAAGIYNPVVFRKLIKSWNADNLIPCTKEFYENLEEFLQTKFHNHTPITRIFANDHQRIEWENKYADPEYTNYLQNIAPNLPDEIKKNTSHGAGIVTGSGQVNTKILIESFKSYLQKQNLLTEGEFDFDQLLIQEDGISYNNEDFDKVIFCEGYLGSENPYFNWLPFAPTKGELITLEIKNLQLNTIISKGVFLMPMGNDLYKLGSTFNWKNPDFEPSQQGKSELLQKFTKFYSGPFKIISHDAAIRPTVKDRRPFIGLHPLHESLGIFNGLGSKGLMLGPYYASQFVGFLNGKSKLDREVNLLRYYGK